MDRPCNAAHRPMSTDHAIDNDEEIEIVEAGEEREGIPSELWIDHSVGKAD